MHAEHICFFRVKLRFWRRAQRSQLIAAWVRLAAIGTGVIGMSGILAWALGYAVAQAAGIDSFRSKMFLLSPFDRVPRRHFVPDEAQSAAFQRSAVCSWPYFCWLSCLDHSLAQLRHGAHEDGRNRFAWRSDGPESAASACGANEEFATNKHGWNSLAEQTERSYAYAALSQRPVLVEGYLDHQVKHPFHGLSMLRR